MRSVIAITQAVHLGVGRSDKEISAARSALAPISLKERTVSSGVSSGSITPGNAQCWLQMSFCVDAEHGGLTNLNPVKLPKMTAATCSPRPPRAFC